jgi:hypothetical protein
MIEHRLSEDGSRAFVTLAGDLTDDGALEWFTQFVDSLAGRIGVGGIVDTTDVGELKISTDGVRRITEVALASQNIFEGSRWALVAERDALFGLARMYEILRSDAPYEIMVFREMEPAREWLDGGA